MKKEYLVLAPYLIGEGKKIDGLYVPIVSKLVTVLKELEAKGWHAKIASAMRDKAVQAEKVRKGYSQTKHSKHLTGHAVDIVDARYLWNLPLSHQFWKDLGVAAKRQGFKWGGDWKTFKDVAHVEFI